MKRKTFAAFSTLLFLSPFVTSTTLADPLPRLWNKIGTSRYTALRNIPACKAFHDLMIMDGLAKKDRALYTDQATILKSGQIVYEVSDGTYRPETLHCLWSTSKSITTTLAGAAIQRGWFNPEDRISKFFPASEYRSALASQSNEKYYNEIRIKHLLEMSSNFIWDEAYESDPKASTFLPMLYGPGSKDMLRYSLAQPMDVFGPGTKWTYSGGNSMILMGLLAKKSSQNGSSPSRFVNDLLLNPLGLTQSFFEADAKGHFIGNSYFFSTPEEMLKVGLLYLKNGVFGQKRILSEDWINRTQQLSGGLSNLNRVQAVAPPEVHKKFVETLKSKGPYSQTGFWINTPVRGLTQKQYPKSPDDLYFTAGHYGQLIMVIPSQDMVIARTAHDKFYKDRVDELVSSAVKCFSDERWQNALQ